MNRFIVAVARTLVAHVVVISSCLLSSDPHSIVKGIAAEASLSFQLFPLCFVSDYIAAVLLTRINIIVRALAVLTKLLRFSVVAELVMGFEVIFFHGWLSSNPCIKVI